MILLADPFSDPQSSAGWLTSLGGFGMLALCCWMVLTGKLVLRREFDRMQAERDEWKAMANRTVSVTDRSQGLAAKAIGMAEQATGSGAGVKTGESNVR